MVTYVLVGFVYFYKKQSNKGRVLAERIELSASPSNVGSPTPESTSEPTIQASPTISSPTPAAKSPSTTPKQTTTSTPRQTAISTPTTTPHPTQTSTSSATARSTNTPTPSPSNTPTALPTPSAAPVVYTSEQINGFITKYSGIYGVSPDILRHIAICESGFNPRATNLGYAGLYQFGSTTWSNFRLQMGENTHPDLRFNADEAVKTASYVLKQNKAYIWPNCVP